MSLLFIGYVVFGWTGYGFGVEKVTSFRQTIAWKHLPHCLLFFVGNW